MYTLHIANKNYSSWSLRSWVLMRELGIEFEEVLHPFGLSDKGFKDFSPSGRVPCLMASGETVWDSLAIAEFLFERHQNIWPASAPARNWARCASAEMHSGFATIRNACSMSCGVRVSLHATTYQLESEWARLAVLWQEGLERFGGPFLAGEKFSAVDAFFAPICFRIQTYQPALPESLTPYIERMLALPSMMEWYEAALREPWRDVAHEDEIMAAGVLVQDLRTVES